MKHLIAIALLCIAAATHAQTSKVEWVAVPVDRAASGAATKTACVDAIRKLYSASFYCIDRVTTSAACPAAPVSTQSVQCVAPATGSWTQTRTVTSAASPTCWTTTAWTPTAAPAGACTTSTTGTWIRLADENQPFTVGTNQTVRFGRSPGPYVQKVVSGAGQCTLAFFGSDPAPGQGKFCDVLEGSGTAAPPPVVVIPPPVVTGSAALSWVAPTKNADGTPLTDLARYRVQYGLTSGLYTDSAVTTGTETSVAIPNLASGRWFFVVKAVDISGNESAPSSELSKTIP